MKEEKEIKQPDAILREKLDEIFNATPEEVTVNGHKYKIGWIHPGTERKFTHVTVKEKNPYKANCKIAAIIILNNVWLIRLFYWIVWRWFYYVRDLDTVEVLKMLDVAKKKVQHEAFYLVTIYLTEMTDLMMTMTSQEVNRIQAAQRGAQPSV